MAVLPPTTRDHPVWQALTAHRIEPETPAFSFAAKLARENGWTPVEAAEVAEEYRRFCFLAATGDRPVTPSDAVDQAWHLHLTFTRDYWERFCPQVLGRPLHHDPGGGDDRARFFAQYADTLARYEQAFGSAPPAAWWPGAARRLIDDPRARRVHPRDALIVPRRTARILLWVGIVTVTGGLSWLLI